MSITQLTAIARQQVDQALREYLSHVNVSDELQQAMSHGVLLGGKRIRPYITLTVAKICNGNSAMALQAACAIEAIHAYSLIHDDLPAMDDDALRRGQPTCHIKFNEATAILAADALQALAIDILSTPVAGIASQVQLSMLKLLAKASGANGMVGGQSLDLQATRQQLNEQQLQRIHEHKTGALIKASAELGVLCGDTPAHAYRPLFAEFAHYLGLAFQVQDDILDVTSSTDVLGKPQGSDQQSDKSTYVKLLGLDGAQQKLLTLHRQALQSLENIPYNTAPLAHFAEVLLNRNH